ncbi:hypothetical protein [Methyloglobulus sp.]|uniref:hypothetical protein n=1 Tax=Methyloglobulus sp. TaxID=2518622 RepID=UPI0032B77B59
MGPPPIPEEAVAVILFWISIVVYALVVTLYQCYKRKFIDNAICRRHCRFWLRSAALFYFINFAVALFFGSTNENSPLYTFDKINVDSFYLLKDLLSFLLIPSLMLLVGSLVPAKLQNWFGKNVKGRKAD